MRNRAQFWRCLRMLAILAVAVAVPGQLRAQPPLSNLCQTAFGICAVGYAPINTPCACGPRRDRGRITLPPPDWGNACGTAFGVCRVNFMPIGSRCICGGRDPGQIIGR